MQPDEHPSYAEGLTTTHAVDPGGLFRTVRLRDVLLADGHGTPPRVGIRI